MTQYKNEVEKRKLFLESEIWGQTVSMHYMCKGSGDAGFGMGYFIYYNNGAVHRVEDEPNKITIMQKPNSIEEVMDDYGRSQV